MGWKQIKEYPDYEISDEGEILSFRKNKNGMIIKGSIAYGYPVVVLTNQNGSKTFRIHRLVAITFIPNPNNHPQVNHHNDIKTDNYIDNLYWGTQFQNARDAYRNNDGHNSNKPVTQLTKEGEFIMEHKSVKIAAKSVGIKGNAITEMLSGRNKTAGGYKWILNSGGYSKES